jgi:hypothetical protein
MTQDIKGAKFRYQHKKSGAYPNKGVSTQPSALVLQFSFGADCGGEPGSYQQLAELRPRLPLALIKLVRHF